MFHENKKKHVFPLKKFQSGKSDLCRCIEETNLSDKKYPSGSYFLNLCFLQCIHYFSQIQVPNYLLHSLTQIFQKNFAAKIDKLLFFKIICLNINSTIELYCMNHCFDECFLSLKTNRKVLITQKFTQKLDFRAKIRVLIL